MHKLSKELTEKYNLIVEALVYFEKMYMQATTAKNRKIQLSHLQATKKEYAQFCKDNNIN